MLSFGSVSPTSGANRLGRSSAFSDVVPGTDSTWMVDVVSGADGGKDGKHDGGDDAPGTLAMSSLCVVDLSFDARELSKPCKATLASSRAGRAPMRAVWYACIATSVEPPESSRASYRQMPASSCALSRSSSKLAEEDRLELAAALDRLRLLDELLLWESVVCS